MIIDCSDCVVSERKIIVDLSNEINKLNKERDDLRNQVINLNEKIKFQKYL
jgi:hypothetical protein